jgi:hypothetical protein
VPRLVYDVEDPTRLRAALESLDAFVDDRDRKRWLPAFAFSSSAIAYSSVTIGGQGFSAPSLPDAATTTYTATLAVPSTWVNGSFNVDAFVGNNSAGAGNLRFQIGGAVIAPATAGTAALLLLDTVAAPAQNQMKLISSNTPLGVNVVHRLLLVNVTRFGADAADTLAGAAVLLGALVTYNPA